MQLSMQKKRTETDLVVALVYQCMPWHIMGVKKRPSAILVDVMRRTLAFTARYSISLGTIFFLAFFYSSSMSALTNYYILFFISNYLTMILIGNLGRCIQFIDAKWWQRKNVNVEKDIFAHSSICILHGFSPNLSLMACRECADFMKRWYILVGDGRLEYQFPIYMGNDCTHIRFRGKNPLFRPTNAIQYRPMLFWVRVWYDDKIVNIYFRSGMR